jgi:hypothetical protein
MLFLSLLRPFVNSITGSGPEDTCLYIDNNTRIQILDSIDQLPEAEKDQCGAFIVLSLQRFLFVVSYFFLLARRPLRHPLGLQPRKHHPSLQRIR